MANELEKDSPKFQRIRQWQKDIGIHQKRLEILLTRLPQSKEGVKND